jgi:hypothetical protein
MTSPIPLALHTAYAELLDRCGSSAFGDAFPKDGVFVAKTIKGRRYWYFQTSSENGRGQRYVGLETPKLLEQIRNHKDQRSDQRERQALVSALLRSARLARPIPEIGETVKALADAGVFRLRGVLVGTVAYQIYAAMLGVRLAAASIQTGDVDVAQFRNVSVAVEDELPPMLDVLRKVDPSFRPVPHLKSRHSVTSYAAKGGIRVDFLTPNQGPDTDTPARLPALGTDAQQLRYLDFLIHEPEAAVMLYRDGVYVQVPAPQRYAVHKLIVARHRMKGSGKSDKDAKQAETLLDVLIGKRPLELRAAWQEAIGRGKKWRQLLGEGLGLVDPDVRDGVLRVVGSTRDIIPDLDLKFSEPPARYDAHRDVVEFVGEAGGKAVRCAISREALEDHFGAGGADPDGSLRTFRTKRSIIERMARMKYLRRPVEDVGGVLIGTGDVVSLLKGKGSG